MRAPFLAGLLLLGALVVAAHADETADVRALWVVRTTLTSPASIRTMVAAAKAGGYNTLFVQVRGRGDAYYRSRVEPVAAALRREPGDFDPLALVLREARAAGLKVHAWVNANLVGDPADLPSDRRHVVRRHPDWLMLPRELVPTLGRQDPKDPRYLARLVSWTRSQSSTVEGLYASPAHPGAVAHLLDVVDDLVTRYDLDGVHFDYIRYPGAAFDFSRAARQAFADEMAPRLSKSARADLKRQVRTNPLVYIDRYPAAWADFRRTQVTTLLRRLRARIHARRPHTVVSAAVVPNPDEARESRGQDWPSWLRQGLLDVVCPMAYTTDAETFSGQVSGVQRAAEAAGRRVFAGVGAYRLSPEQTILHVVLAREAGVDGFILFSYDSFAAQDKGTDALVQIGHAVSGR